MSDSGYKILIVDDSEPIRELLRLYLTRYDFEVEELGSGEALLDLFQKGQGRHIDLVLIDYIMKGMDGFHASQELLKIDPNIPIVMLTAFSNVNLATRFMQVGGSGFVEKPVNVESDYLNSTLREILNYTAANREMVEEKTDQPVKNNDLPLSTLFRDAKDRPPLEFPDPHVQKPWKVLIIDDDEQVHRITSIILFHYLFNGCELKIISAYSAEEAKRELDNNPDTAVVLLDIIMETKWAGFDVVKHIRKTMGNQMMRIIIRSGQSGEYPQSNIVTDYEVDGFLAKERMNPLDLTVALTTALRTYHQLAKLSFEKQQLVIENQQLKKQLSKATSDDQS